MNRIYFYLVLAASVSALATDMIVPALPELQRAFQVDYSLIQLSISGFLIIYACSQLIVGFLGERFGKLNIITLGFIIFSAGSLVCFFSGNFYMLLTGRFLQALGAGAGPVLSRAIAKDILPPEKLKKSLSDISSASAVVPLIAPLAGGAMLGYLSWNFMFLTMFLFGVVAVMFAPRKSIPTVKTEKKSGTGFVTREFIAGTLLVSFMLSALFCYITLSPAIFIEKLGLTPFEYSLIFSTSVLFFIAGNQASKLRFFSNGLFLFLLNAVSLIPFLSGTSDLRLLVLSAIVFNFTLGAYYPNAHFMSLQIKGNKTGVASSITGFTQTVSAGAISFAAVRITAFDLSFEKAMGVSGLLLAMVSLAIVVYLRSKECRTGKKIKSTNL